MSYSSLAPHGYVYVHYEAKVLEGLDKYSWVRTILRGLKSGTKSDISVCIGISKCIKNGLSILVGIFKIFFSVICFQRFSLLLSRPIIIILIIVCSILYCSNSNCYIILYYSAS